jgi:putative ABC transport system substrate-binding protein
MFEVAERALASRGWIKGKTVALDYRITGGDAVQIANATTELVRLNVDILYCWGAPALRAAYAATRTIPIVAMDFTTDPVAAGYAESYSHPGRNVTGVFLDAPEFAAKWLELLKTIVPGLSRVAVVWDPVPGQVHLRAVQGAARSLGVDVQILEVRKLEDIEKAFAALRERAQAAIFLPSPMMYANNATNAAVAMKRRVPAITLWREFTEAGGAASYGPYQPAYVERSAALVASILGGSKPGDLPIERPTKFEFIVNLKTIKALGLTIPESILLRADEVIR